MINLKNKNIIITGASGGIGNSIVKKLSEFQANILATGTKIEKLEELKSKIKNVQIQSFDISKSEKIEEFVEKATTQLGGKLDCIVNNAGLTRDNLAIRMSLDEWKRVIEVNLTSTFLLSKFAIKKMLKNKSGKIVNITSVVGHTGNLGQANYTASKAGIVAMSKSLAIEYAKKNINVNCISPGFIKTAMTDKLDPKFKELILSKIPSGRLGEPTDIANAVLFLASDQSNYINGETIHIIKGSLAILLFNKKKQLINKIILNKKNKLIYRIPTNLYHTVQIKSNYAIYHETKKGPFVRKQTILA